MKLEITWDNLDTAIEQLKELAEKIKQFPKDVAQESMSHISYSGTGVSYSEGENKVFASSHGIAFQEFGAGFYADETTLNIDGKNVSSYPGVWSADHARTFQAWQFRQLGRMNTSERVHDSQYPYNVEPSHTMQNEAERLRRDTEARAKDYFA